MTSSSAHDALARETDASVSTTRRPGTQLEFLTEVYELWKDCHGTTDTSLKVRLSLVELLFRSAEERARELSRAAPEAITKVARAEQSIPAGPDGDALSRRDPTFARDELTKTRIADALLGVNARCKWADVDRELKEAIEHADVQHHDEAFHAAKALESTIKIISDDKGWSTGRERGAQLH
ncbi:MULTISPECIES: hypothetical protein [unclassified Bradyrhizobium]